jgi:peptidoglycan/LPS O-acetylase OafA/YrhL
MGWCRSLAIEEQFYLIFPAFVLIFMRFRPKLQILGLLMLASGIIRWIIIDRHGFIPPFLDTPDMQSRVDRFSIEYQNLYTRHAGLLSGIIGAFVMVYHRGRVQEFLKGTARALGRRRRPHHPDGLLHAGLATIRIHPAPRGRDLLLASPRRVFDLSDVPDPRGDPRACCIPSRTSRMRP